MLMLDALMRDAGCVMRDAVLLADGESFVHIVEQEQVTYPVLLGHQLTNHIRQHFIVCPSLLLPFKNNSHQRVVGTTQHQHKRALSKLQE